MKRSAFKRDFFGEVSKNSGAGFPPKVDPPLAGKPAPVAFILLTFLFFLAPPFAGSESTIRVVNGRVKEVMLSERQLVLSFRRPSTGEIKEQVIQVDDGTGFKEGSRLEDFRENDPVSVDYVETPGRIPRALLIRSVPLQGGVPSLTERDIARVRK